MRKFLNLYVTLNSESTRSDIEKKLSLAIDWYRYDDHGYIIYTSSEIDKWQVRLLDFVKTDGRLFICELKIENRNGWMNKAFWDWLKKYQNKSA